MLVSAQMRSAQLFAVLALATANARAQPADPPAPEPPPEVEPPPAPPAQPTPPTPPLAAPPRVTNSGGAAPSAAPPEPATKPPDQRAITEDLAALAPDTGYRFGSYGRVIAGTDLRGGKPEQLLIVAHGPRIVENSYLELESSYGFQTRRGVKLRPVITLAFDGTLFHDTGEFDAHPALRNLFLEASVAPHVTAWVGSRMYRGDDIYLFDYWPLDNQNTVGGGAIYHDAGLELAVHAGVNRLLVPFQYQTIEVPNPAQGATTVVQLNRQRIVASATAAYVVDAGPGRPSIKVKLHGQFHALPAGTRARCDMAMPPTCDGYEHLPSDTGLLVGAEASVFGMSSDPEDRRHVNLYARYAKGLAAFDELAPPTTFGPDLTTQKASELSFGLSGNWDMPLGNMMVGALSRRFIDATGDDAPDPDNGWEYAVDARPLARFAPDWFAGADVSYQARFPRGLNPITERPEDASIVQVAPMIVFSPMGGSAYDRPQLRAVYRVAHLDQGALDLYVPDDPRHAHAWVHFLGLEAEWWFNSTSYR